MQFSFVCYEHKKSYAYLNLYIQDKNTPPSSEIAPEENVSMDTGGHGDQGDTDDDVFDDDFDDEEQVYSVQELSKILKENRKGDKETDQVYESIQNMKSRSLTRCGSTRPPPRPLAKVSKTIYV